MMRNLLTISLLCLLATANAQYSETFSTPNKGYLTNFVNDFTGVNWTMTSWTNDDPPNNIIGRDASDYFQTTAGGVLECIDLDQEVCWVGPVLTVSSTGNIQFTADISWAGFDVNQSNPLEFVNVEYQINNGAWVRHPNIVGANGDPAYTVRYIAGTGPFGGNATTDFGNIAVTAGNTFKVRVCVSDNANAEIVTIDNVNVTGVTSGCAPPTLSSVITQVGCSNPNSGAIDLSVSAGTPGYTYAWSNGPTTQDISGIPVGTYTVTVTDAASCSATLSTSVTAAPAIVLSTQVLNTTCAGTLDGEIGLDVSGGVPGYTYDWSNDGPENPDNDPQDLIGVGTGTYTVTVTDASGCTKTISATVNVQPSGAYLEQFNTPNKGYLANQIDDFAGVDWTLSSWSLEPPAPFGRDVQDFFHTSGGALVANDLDQEVCWTSPLIDINPPGTGVMFSLALAWVGLDNNVDEYINVNYSVDGGGYTQVPNIVGGGAGTIQYNSGLDQNGSTTVSVTGLSGNTLQIQVCGNINSNNETFTLDNVSVPGSNPYCPAPEPTLTPTNVTCNGASNGTITTTVVNGQTPYTYLWSNMATTMNLTGLGPGTYTVTVTDANMLTGTASVMITEPPVLTLSGSAVNPSTCATPDGSIDISVSGGVTPYSYDWSNDGPENPDNDPQDLNSLSNGTYTVTVTDANGCTKTASYTLFTPDTDPPTITCPANTTVAVNASCQATLGSYSAATLSDNCNPAPTVTQSPASSTMLNGHNATQMVTLTADDGSGNTSTCTFTVTAKDVTPPSIACPANATVNADASCQGMVGSHAAATLSDNCNPTPIVTQSPASSTILTGHNATQIVTLTADDGNGNTSTCTLTVTLKDVTPPAITCPPNATVNANASCQGMVGSYTAATLSDNCNPAPIVTQSPSSSTMLTGHNATQLVTLTANDGNGNTATCTLTVTLKDVTPPTVTCPANATVNANASCQGTVGSYSAATLSDNCNPAPIVTQSPASSTLLTGHNATQIVTLTADDGNGNTSTCTLTVTLKDVTPPSITCPANATVNANASCQGTLGSYSAASLSDNCNPASTVTQSPASSTILTGHNATQLVTLTANDGNGNSSTCTLTVTLKDVTPPAITCPANATVNANASCQGMLGSYSPASLSDNCNPAPIVTQSPASSTILTGHNATQTVTLTANDGNGNTSTCTLTVTLKDVTPPSITCPANATVNANASCQGTLGSYSAASLSDNCNPASTVTQSPASSTILTGHNATQLVTLTANDGNGNSSTCTLTVTLKDVTPPNITCPANATVNANASCQGTLGSYSPASLSDNCNPAPTATQSPAAGTLLTGHNATQTVTLTANDGNGNSSTCTFSVTLKDVTAPSITCPANLTINANASCQGALGSYSAATLSDNCNPAPIVTQSPAAGTLLTGHNAVQTVTLTANDGNGNTSTCTFTVTLRDISPPTVVCKPYTAILGANGLVSITMANVYQSGSDNCGTVNQQSVIPSSFNCNNIGANTVTLTVNDGHGNTASCSATVTVVDQTPPTMLCRNITVNLDANGQVTITPAQINNGSFDNCSIIAYALSQSVFTCANVGNNNVVLGGADPSSNKGQCTAVVTVVDPIVPMAKCKDASVNLGSNGLIMLNPALLNNGSSDNCTFTLTTIPSTLSCANIGMNTVVLRATDASGNSATCTAQVTVSDQTAPNAQCKNPTIYLDNIGQAVLSIADVDNGSSDACGFANISISKSQFNCSELAGSPWPVTLSMTDVNGNSSSCLAYVTVRDAIPPTAVCEDVTVYLGSNGKAVVYGADLAHNSTDNCSVWSYSPIAKVYTSANLGLNNLTITVKDWSGNASTCVSVVEVLSPTPNNLGNNNGDDDRHFVGDLEVYELVLFPNPTSGDATLSFQLQQEQTYSLRLFDLAGRMVLSREDVGLEGENNLALYLSGQAPGVYLLDFKAGEWKVQKRLVIQRD